MKTILLISLNTVKEIRRHKVLYALAGVVLFIIFTGLILGPLSLNEQRRLSINFAFVACHLGLILITIYFASSLISYEIEKKTIILLFARPIARFEFILGKFFGLSFFLLATSLLLTVFLVGLHLIYSHSITPVLFLAMGGSFLEALILLAVAFFFSSFVNSPFLVLSYSFLIFIVGHSINGLTFLLDKIQEKETLIGEITVALTRALPNFEKLNWRTQALYQDTLTAHEVIFSSLYACSWVTFLLIITGILFQRKCIA